MICSRLRNKNQMQLALMNVLYEKKYLNIDKIYSLMALRNGLK